MNWPATGRSSVVHLAEFPNTVTTIVAFFTIWSPSLAERETDVQNGDTPPIIDRQRITLSVNLLIVPEGKSQH